MRDDDKRVIHSCVRPFAMCSLICSSEGHYQHVIVPCKRMCVSHNSLIETKHTCARTRKHSKKAKQRLLNCWCRAAINLASSIAFEIGTDAVILVNHGRWTKGKAGLKKFRLHKCKQEPNIGPAHTPRNSLLNQPWRTKPASNVNASFGSSHCSLASHARTLDTRQSQNRGFWPFQLHRFGC